MIISKKTNPEELDKISNGDNIQITKDVALNQDFLLAIATRFPDSKISIFSGYDSRETHSEQNPFFDNEQLKTLNENAKILLEQHKIKLVFDDDISIEQATLANRKFNNWVSDIQKASIDGKELSDLEKFLWAYQIVTERVYTLETSEETTAKSRNLFEVLTGDKIVCVGYANMLVALCTKLGVKCTFQTVSTIDPNTNVFGNHATVAVRIDDEKYGIHGIFYSNISGVLLLISSVSGIITGILAAKLIEHPAIKKIFSL